MSVGGIPKVHLSATTEPGDCGDVLVNVRAEFGADVERVAIYAAESADGSRVPTTELRDLSGYISESGSTLMVATTPGCVRQFLAVPAPPWLSLPAALTVPTQVAA